MEKLDMINYPPHYTSGGIENVDFVMQKGLNFCLGNVVKYVVRAGKKRSSSKSITLEAKALEDLKKAAWYLNKEIEFREAQMPKKEGPKNADN